MLAARDVVSDIRARDIEGGLRASHRLQQVKCVATQQQILGVVEIAGATDLGIVTGDLAAILFALAS